MSNIKNLKNQSLLREVLQEAICSLEDNRINTLSITGIKCSNGKYFARVLLDSTFIDESKRNNILKLLKKADNIIRKYVQSTLSWYRIPNFVYEFDLELEGINKLDSIFKKIKGKSYE